MKRIFCISCFLCLVVGAFAADLSITSDDIAIRTDPDSEGLIVYIKKTGDINSVILCETTKDPSGVMANYTFRDRRKNHINGSEFRMLDGKLLDAAEAHYSIVSSTVYNDEKLGECFRLYMPPEMVFGYPDTRHGTQKLEDGMFVNIRTFALPYADYTGEFADNPFLFNISQAEDMKIMDEYNPETVSAFKEISKLNSGMSLYSESPSDLVEKVEKTILPNDEEENLDIVFVLDATQSMHDDIEALRMNLISSIKSTLEKYESCRMGLVIYKDYGDELAYNGIPVRVFDFTENTDDFEKNLLSFRVSGGHDYEEAVYEGLYAAAEFMSWRKDAERRITLIGDAEPHATPRGSGLYSSSLVQDVINKKNIQVNTIILFDPDR
ncbi:MAG: VWA domain-containing protein [Spirochaetaceae bacterium]|nr:VWA domain-containing protein [Spirochaetaceae bacterium]